MLKNRKNNKPSSYSIIEDKIEDAYETDNEP